MPDLYYGGLDFGSSGARISIINLNKKLVYSNSVPYLCSFKNPNSWINSCENLLVNLPIEVKINLNKWMVRNGNAVAYKRYSKDYVRDEAYAKENKLGVWEGSFMMPEKWRKLN